MTGENKLTIGGLGWVENVVFSPDGETLASRSNDEPIRLWAVATGEQKGVITWGMRLSISSVTFSPDGKTLASAEENGTVYLWDGVTGRHKRTSRRAYGLGPERRLQSGREDAGKWG